MSKLSCGTMVEMYPGDYYKVIRYITEFNAYLMKDNFDSYTEMSATIVNERYRKMKMKSERPKLKGKYLVMTDSGQVLGGNPESTFEYYEDAQEAARLAAEKCPTNRTYYVASLACRFTSRTEVRMEIV